MCDTLYASQTTTADSLALFAKNSDRPPNEAQHLAWYPARSYSGNEKLQCTYIEIPQARETYSILLSKPYWMWGAEMGVNQFGLAIGNEAVFSKVPANKIPALLGMDLLRLGLERAKTAPEAVEVIASLLEEFGQGGNCAQDGHLYYHNSFLITDPRECWVLETVARHWAARRVDPIYSISNLLSIEQVWDRASEGFGRFSVENRLSPAEDRVNFRADYSDLIFTTFSAGARRCQRSRELLAREQGQIGVETMAAVLRDHRGQPDPSFGLAGAEICMHASLGPIRISQTTGSLIVSLEEGNPLAFATGTAAPCTGIFKPVWVDTPPSRPQPVPDNHYDPETLFWAHERLHRKVLENYPARLEAYSARRDALEREFILGAFQRRNASREERRAFSEDCFLRAAAAEEEWLELVREVPSKFFPLHRAAWQGLNSKADFH